MSDAASAEPGQATQYGRYYYAHDCGIPYERNEHWLTFFGIVADRLIARYRPATMIDAGCAMGFLVEAMRERGVEAYGIDVSQFAIDSVHESIAEHCVQGSLAEPWPAPLPEKVDLVTCIEVIEHLPASDEHAALVNLTSHADRVMFSSSPLDYAEPTHINVHPPEHWGAAFAELGFLRDLDALEIFPGDGVPWATVFERSSASGVELVQRYERAYWNVRHEVSSLRGTVVEMQGKLEAGVDQSEAIALRAEIARLQEQLLVARDAAMGAEIALGEALGRYQILEAEVSRYTDAATYLDQVLRSNTWRAAKAVTLPYQKLRQRLGR